MNEDRLRELSVELKKLFTEYGIEHEGFQLKILVREPYYDSIKDQFSNRNPILDLVVGTQDLDENWVIELMCIYPLLGDKYTKL